MQLVEDALTPACLSADRYTAQKKRDDPDDAE